MATHSSVLTWRIPWTEQPEFHLNYPPEAAQELLPLQALPRHLTAESNKVLGFPGSSVVKNPPAKAGDSRDAGLIPELQRSPGGGNGNPLQFSCLGNPMDRGAWWVTVHGVAKESAMT